MNKRDERFEQFAREQGYCLEYSEAFGCYQDERTRTVERFWKQAASPLTPEQAVQPSGKGNAHA